MAFVGGVEFNVSLDMSDVDAQFRAFQSKMRDKKIHISTQVDIPSNLNSLKSQIKKEFSDFCIPLRFCDDDIIKQAKSTKGKLKKEFSDFKIPIYFNEGDLSNQSQRIKKKYSGTSIDISFSGKGIDQLEQRVKEVRRQAEKEITITASVKYAGGQTQSVNRHQQSRETVVVNNSPTVNLNPVEIAVRELGFIFREVSEKATKSTNETLKRSRPSLTGNIIRGFQEGIGITYAERVTKGTIKAVETRINASLTKAGEAAGTVAFRVGRLAIGAGLKKLGVDKVIKDIIDNSQEIVDSVRPLATKPLEIIREQRDKKLAQIEQQIIQLLNQDVFLSQVPTGSKSGITFAVPGFSKNPAERATALAQQIQQVQPNKTVVPIAPNDYVQIPYDVKEDPVRGTAAIIDKLLASVETYDTYQKSVIETLAKIIAVRQQQPDIPIEILGHSQGGEFAKDVVYLAERFGVKGIKGTSIGTPDFSVSSPQNFSSLMGEKDTLAALGGKSTKIPGVMGHSQSDYFGSEKAVQEMLSGVTKMSQVVPKIETQIGKNLSKAVLNLGNVIQVANIPQIEKGLIRLSKALLQTTYDLAAMKNSQTQLQNLTEISKAIKTIGSAPIEGLLQRQEEIALAAINAVEKRAQQIISTLPDQIDKEQVVFGVGGFAGLKGESSPDVAQRIGMLFPDSEIIALRNLATDIGVNLEAGLDKWSAQVLAKLFDLNVIKGFNPDAIELAAQAKAYHQKFGKPIYGIGYSAGGLPIQQAAKLTQMMNIPYQGIGIGTPDFGATRLKSSNYQTVLAESDPISRLTKLIQKITNQSSSAAFVPSSRQGLDAHKLSSYLSNESFQQVIKSKASFAQTKNPATKISGFYELIGIQKDIESYYKNLSSTLQNQSFLMKSGLLEPSLQELLGNILVSRKELENVFLESSGEISVTIAEFDTALEEIQSVIQNSLKISLPAQPAFKDIKSLSVSADQTYKEILKQAASISKISLQGKNIPKLRIDSQRLEKMGAQAFYDIKNNTIVINKEIAEALASGADGIEEYQKTLSSLIHEIRHSFQFDFGSIDFNDIAKGFSGVELLNPENLPKSVSFNAQRNVADAAKQGGSFVSRDSKQAIFKTEADAYGFEFLATSKIIKQAKDNLSKIQSQSKAELISPPIIKIADVLSPQEITTMVEESISESLKTIKKGIDQSTKIFSDISQKIPKTALKTPSVNISQSRLESIAVPDIATPEINLEPIELEIADTLSDFYQQIIELYSENIGKIKTIPQLQIGDTDFDAQGLYDPIENIIVISEELANRVKKGIVELNDVETLIHELRHGQQIGFGELKQEPKTISGYKTKLLTPDASESVYQDVITTAKISTDMAMSDAQAMGYSPGRQFYEKLMATEIDAEYIAKLNAAKIKEQIRIAQSSIQKSVSTGKQLSPQQEIAAKLDSVKENASFLISENFSEFIDTIVDSIESNADTLIESLQSQSAPLSEIAEPTEQARAAVNMYNNALDVLQSSIANIDQLTDSELLSTITLVEKTIEDLTQIEYSLLDKTENIKKTTKTLNPSQVKTEAPIKTLAPQQQMKGRLNAIKQDAGYLVSDEFNKFLDGIIDSIESSADTLINRLQSEGAPITEIEKINKNATEAIDKYNNALDVLQSSMINIQEVTDQELQSVIDQVEQTIEDITKIEYSLLDRIEENQTMTSTPKIETPVLNADEVYKQNILKLKTRLDKISKDSSQVVTSTFAKQLEDGLKQSVKIAEAAIKSSPSSMTKEIQSKRDKLTLQIESVLDAIAVAVEEVDSIRDVDLEQLLDFATSAFDAINSFEDSINNLQSSVDDLPTIEEIGEPTLLERLAGEKGKKGEFTKDQLAAMVKASDIHGDTNLSGLTKEALAKLILQRVKDQDEIEKLIHWVKSITVKGKVQLPKAGLEASDAKKQLKNSFEMVSQLLKQAETKTGQQQYMALKRIYDLIEEQQRFISDLQKTDLGQKGFFAKTLGGYRSQYQALLLGQSDASTDIQQMGILAQMKANQGYTGNQSQVNPQMLKRYRANRSTLTPPSPAIDPTAINEINIPNNALIKSQISDPIKRLQAIVTDKIASLRLIALQSIKEVSDRIVEYNIKTGKSFKTLNEQQQLKLLEQQAKIGASQVKSQQIIKETRAFGTEKIFAGIQKGIVTTISNLGLGVIQSAQSLSNALVQFSLKTGKNIRGLSEQQQLSLLQLSATIETKKQQINQRLTPIEKAKTIKQPKLIQPDQEPQLQQNISPVVANNTLPPMQTDEGMNALATFKNSIKEVYSQIEKADPKIAGIINNIKQFAVAAAAGYFLHQFTRQLLSLSSQALETTRRFQVLQNTINFISGGPQQGAETMSFIRQEVERTSGVLEPAAQGFAKLAAASRNTRLEGEPTREVFSAITQAAGVFGLTADETSGAILAVGQMMGKGVVSAEELRGQLAERIPGAFQVAARAMNMTEQEFFKLMSTGQLASAEFLPKFAKQLSMETAGGVAGAAKTATGAMNRFNNAVTEAQVAFGKTVTPVQVAALNVAGGALKLLADNATFLAQSLAIVAGGTAVMLGGLVKVQVAALLAKVGITSIKALLPGLIAGLKTLGMQFLYVTLAIEGIKVVWQLFEVMAGRNRLKEYADEAAKSFEKVGDAAKQAGRDTKESSPNTPEELGGYLGFADKFVEKIGLGKTVRFKDLNWDKEVQNAAKGSENIDKLAARAIELYQTRNQVGGAVAQVLALDQQIQQQQMTTLMQPAGSEERKKAQAQLDVLRQQRTDAAKEIITVESEIQSQIQRTQQKLKELRPGSAQANILEGDLARLKSAQAFINKLNTTVGTIDPWSKFIKAINASADALSRVQRETAKFLTEQKTLITQQQIDTFSTDQFATQKANVDRARVEREAIQKQIEETQKAYEQGQSALADPLINAEVSGLGVDLRTSSIEELKRAADGASQENIKRALEEAIKIREIEANLGEQRLQLAEATLREKQAIEQSALNQLERDAAKANAAIQAGASDNLIKIKGLQLDRKLTEAQASAEIAKVEQESAKQREAAITEQLRELKKSHRAGEISAETMAQKELELTQQIKDAKVQAIDAELQAREALKRQRLDEIEFANRLAEAEINAQRAGAGINIKQKQISNISSLGEFEAGRVAEQSTLDVDQKAAQENLKRLKERMREQSNMLREGLLTDREYQEQKLQIQQQIDAALDQSLQLEIQRKQAEKRIRQEDLDHARSMADAQIKLEQTQSEIAIKMQQLAAGNDAKVNRQSALASSQNQLAALKDQSKVIQNAIKEINSMRNTGLLKGREYDKQALQLQQELLDNKAQQLDIELQISQTRRDAALEEIEAAKTKADNNQRLTEINREIGDLQKQLRTGSERDEAGAIRTSIKGLEERKKLLLQEVAQIKQLGNEGLLKGREFEEKMAQSQIGLAETEKQILEQKLALKEKTGIVDEETKEAEKEKVNIIEQQNKELERQLQLLDIEANTRKLSLESTLSQLTYQQRMSDVMGKQAEMQSSLITSRLNLEKAVLGAGETVANAQAQKIQSFVDMAKELGASDIALTGIQQIEVINKRIAGIKERSRLLEEKSARLSLQFENQRNMAAAKQAELESKIAQLKAQQAKIDTQAALDKAKLSERQAQAEIKTLSAQNAPQEEIRVAQIKAEQAKLEIATQERSLINASQELDLVGQQLELATENISIQGEIARNSEQALNVQQKAAQIAESINSSAGQYATTLQTIRMQSEAIEKASEKQRKNLESISNLSRAASGYNQTVLGVAGNQADRALEIVRKLKEGNLKSGQRQELSRQLQELGFAGNVDEKAVLDYKFRLENQIAQQKQQALINEQNLAKTLLDIDLRREELNARRLVQEAQLLKLQAKDAKTAELANQQIEAATGYLNEVIQQGDNARLALAYQQAGEQAQLRSENLLNGQRLREELSGFGSANNLSGVPFIPMSVPVQPIQYSPDITNAQERSKFNAEQTAAAQSRQSTRQLNGEFYGAQSINIYVSSEDRGIGEKVESEVSKSLFKVFDGAFRRLK